MSGKELRKKLSYSGKQQRIISRDKWNGISLELICYKLKCHKGVTVYQRKN